MEKAMEKKLCYHSPRSQGNIKIITERDLWRRQQETTPLPFPKKSRQNEDNKRNGSVEKTTGNNSAIFPQEIKAI